MKTERGFTRGLVLGLIGGGVLLCVGSGIVYATAQRWSLEHRKGWNLVPIIVASVDLKAGEVVGMEALSQRSIPEQFVAPAMIKPDSASDMVNDTTLVPLQAGDVFLWHGMRAGSDALKLARDVAPGARLTADDVVRVSRRPEHFTVTMVRADQLDAVLNARAVRALKRDDALHFSDLVAPEAR